MAQQQSWQEQAEARVRNTPALAEEAEFILADWSEGQEHYEWVATAPVTEILDWVRASR